MITPVPSRRLSAADQAVACIMLGQVVQLAGLKDWPPVGTLCADVIDLARGQGSISGRDAQRLNTWVRRWSQVHPDVRAFYERNADHAAVGPALWAILDLRRRPSGKATGWLYQLWAEQHGIRPSINLVPQFP